jgi:hypothetical protein
MLKEPSLTKKKQNNFQSQSPLQTDVSDLENTVTVDDFDTTCLVESQPLPVQIISGMKRAFLETNLTFKLLKANNFFINGVKMKVQFFFFLNTQKDYFIVFYF